MKSRILKAVGLSALVLFELIAASVISLMIILYGPFQTVKKFVVGTAMSSYTHQYVAKWFLSNAQINDILKTRTVAEKQKTGGIQFNYSDTSIDEYSVKGSKYNGYLLVIKNPKRLKIGSTKQLTVEGERTSEIARDNNAVAAVNGGGFTDKSQSGKEWAGTGAYPSGFLIQNGSVVYKEIDKDTRSYVVGFDDKGTLLVGRRSINELLKLSVTDALQFDPKTYSPLLVINGKPAFDGDGGSGMTARTAIGQKTDGSILLLVLDGRNWKSGLLGATLKDVQSIMLQNDAYNATCLDGGSSTTMFYNGSVINDPCNALGERSVATAVYVMK